MNNLNIKSNPIKVTTGTLVSLLKSNYEGKADLVEEISKASINAGYTGSEFTGDEELPDDYYDIDAENNLAENFAKLIIKEVQDLSGYDIDNIELGKNDYDDVIKLLNKISSILKNLKFNGCITSIVTFPLENEDMDNLFISHIKEGCIRAIDSFKRSMVIKEPELIEDANNSEIVTTDGETIVCDSNKSDTIVQDKPKEQATEPEEQSSNKVEEVIERKFTLDVVEKNGKVKIICGYDNGTTVEDVKQIPLLFAFPNCWKMYKNQINAVLNLPDIEDFIYKYDTNVLAVDKASKSTIVLQNDKSKVITFAKSRKGNMKAVNRKSAIQFNKDRYSETA